ncbi:acyloxyacyl hydrolase [Salegentibacter sp. HM20]
MNGRSTAVKKLKAYLKILLSPWASALNICFTSLALVFTSQVYSQSEASEEIKKGKSLLSYGLGLQYGTIFAHSEEVQNTSGARPIGIESIIAWQRNDAAAYALCNCYPRQGLLLAFYDYDVEVLGKSGTAAYFLEPTYRISDAFLFSFKGAGGFSYLSNPYHSENNPGNQSYSRHISAYLLVGIGAWLQVSDKLWINPTINYQHISNGGTRQPNKGINWPTAGLALSYQPESRPWYTGVRTSDKFWKDYSPRYDFALLGSFRKSYDDSGERVRYALGGIAIQAAKQVGRLSMLSLGAEAYYDKELEVNLRRDELDASPVKAGVLVGHEFLLGRFQFSQRLGVYVFDQTPYYDRIFHRWGLQYRISHSFSAGFNLLAHRHVAEFVDFRLVYSFQKRK